MATLGEQLDIIKNEAEKQRQNIDANKQNISLQAGADAGSSKVGLATADNLRNLKDLCNGLKELCRSVSNKLDTSLKAFMNCDKSAKIINDESSVKTDDSQDQQPQAQPQQNQGQPQPPQPPVNNNGGGENDGGEEQNNQSNAR
jgi:hypothetical protein